MSIQPIDLSGLPARGCHCWLVQQCKSAVGQANRGTHQSFALLRLPARLHRDQRGTISIVTVFTAMLLLMLLGMVMNVGRQVDGKVRMQNAADAAAYTGGVVLARAMNTLVFTNHMLCDVFAMTAFLREARDENSASFVPKILAAWNKAGGQFKKSQYAPFQPLGQAILQKTPLEQQMVTTYSNWASATSALILPLMEEILSDELIPKYQRAVVVAFPDIAQNAASQVAQQNGTPDFGRGTMQAALWRTSGQPVGGDTADASTRTLPVVDPEMDEVPNQAAYVTLAQSWRYQQAFTYLNAWNNQTLLGFDQEAKMCQFSNLWRSFTCGYLTHLLNVEYPKSNLPMVLRQVPTQAAEMNNCLDQYYNFIGVAYWKQVPETMSRIFDNPTAGSALTYAEVQMFIPRQRLVWQLTSSSAGAPQPTALGGVPGDMVSLPASGAAPPSSGGGAVQWTVGRDGLPTTWDLFTQRWSCHLAPTTQPALAAILQTVPTSPSFNGAGFTPPSLGDVEPNDLGNINAH
jgi:hypothetical protein